MLMVGFKNMTITDTRLLQSLSGPVNEIIKSSVPQQINKVAESLGLKTGVITKFYPYLDKAEVKLDKDGKTVLCRILHRFGGDMIDFYTPLEYEESFDEGLNEPCIIPRASHHVCVLQISDADSEENLLLGHYNNDDVVGFKPAKPGNIKLMSITEPNLYWIEFGPDGLNLRLPDNPSIETGTLPVEMTDGSVYTKKEIDEKLEDLAGTGLSTDEILSLVDDYNSISKDAKYTLFRGDCFTINNNYESSAAITSTDIDNFTVTGTFRTSQDLVGVYWNSKDPITHPYISYGERYDYRDVILECDVEWDGCLFDSDGGYPVQPITSTFTIEMNDGSIYYPVMKDFLTDVHHGYSTDTGVNIPSTAHLKIDFNNIIIKEGGEYVKGNGTTVKVTSPLRLDPSNIKFIMFVVIPERYVRPEFNDEGIAYYEVTRNIDYYLKFENIQVTNGQMGYEHKTLEPHQYRLCEGYDDFYNFNPYRICREMRKLGYVEWLDLYIGASHYYEKSGEIGDLIPVSEDPDEFGHDRTGKMVLDTTVPLNKAFSAWLDCYSRELKANDCPNLVVSVSMENLQCPDDWKQRDSRGNPALTGWIPSTFFYSPCHPDILPYMQSVSEACLDIVVANELPPILQLGEAWWWWNEYIDKDYKSPCFYDAYTKAKYQEEFGKPMEEYISPFVDYDYDMIDWLNKQIVDYSWGIREVIKQDKYVDGKYMALFFPPSVLDTDRVPEMMQRANFLTGIYSPQQLDVLQVEDYDWVTGNPTDPEHIERDRSHHHEAYEIGEKLGFPYSKQHYFGGFVQYPEDGIEFWKLIKKAMNDAIDLGFSEVFVWAGSQVRRDNKMLGYDDYELVQGLINMGGTDIVGVTENEVVPPSVEPGKWVVFPKREEWWNVKDSTILKYRIDGNVVRLSGGEIHLHGFNDPDKDSKLGTDRVIGTAPYGFRPNTDIYATATGKHSDDTPLTARICWKSNGDLCIFDVREEGTWVRLSKNDEFTLDSMFFMV